MATEIVSSKDMEGLFQAMIVYMGINRRTDLDQDKVYYVLQGPGYYMSRFYYLNCQRTKIAIGRDPHNWDLTSDVYLSNYPEHPNELKMNAHYGSLRSSQRSNLLGSMKFPLPDFGKIVPENTKDTAYSEPNKDIIDAIVKKGY